MNLPLRNTLCRVCLLLAIASVSGCANNPPAPDAQAAATTPPAAKAGKAAPKAVPAAAAQSRGTERKVKGLDDWEGTISGTPAKGSKFTRLKIGMSLGQVTNLIGAPGNQYSHPTGKAWIPFYYGSGRYETRLHYRGQGRLVFAGDAGFSSDSHLIGIEHDASETAGS